MDKVFVIIHARKIWPAGKFFESVEQARNYIKMRLPASHAIYESEQTPNLFLSHRYQSRYQIEELRHIYDETPIA